MLPYIFIGPAAVLPLLEFATLRSSSRNSIELLLSGGDKFKHCRFESAKFAAFSSGNDAIYSTVEVIATQDRCHMHCSWYKK